MTESITLVRNYAQVCCYGERNNDYKLLINGNCYESYGERCKV
jgi:hypothetical protein